MNKNYLPENLYRLRKSAGLSQEEFADRLGVSRQAISKWERGEAYPDTENLIAISRLFSVKIDDLINAEDVADSTAPTSVALSEGCADNDRRGASGGKDFDSDEAWDDGDEVLEAEIEKAEARGARVSLSRVLYSVPYPIITVAAFLAIGFLSDGWDWAWTLFLTIPVYYSLVDVIIKRRLAAFAMPVFITFLYCLLGMLYDLWHPLWLLYLLIPVYYPIAEAIDRAIR